MNRSETLVGCLTLHPGLRHARQEWEAEGEGELLVVSETDELEQMLAEGHS